MKGKVSLICIVITWCLANIASAQDYFTEGTRWIELRLDTLKYDSWFTEVSQSNRKDYISNYDIVEYYVQGDSTVDFGSGMTFRYVWQHKEGQPDSIMFVITQDAQTGILSVTKTYEEEYDGASHLCFQYPARLYDFDWQIGKTLDFDDVYGAACTCFPVNLYTFGTIQEIEHNTFGTPQVMDYVAIDSVITYYGNAIKDRKQINTKLIRGIGVTNWDTGYCLFGPVAPKVYSRETRLEMIFTAVSSSTSNVKARCSMTSGLLLKEDWHHASRTQKPAERTTPPSMTCKDASCRANPRAGYI
ncbi:MAG: hypothetical protein ACI4B5_05155 [Bacteroidaceae bacterium]